MAKTYWDVLAGAAKPELYARHEAVRNPPPPGEGRLREPTPTRNHKTALPGLVLDSWETPPPFRNAFAVNARNRQGWRTILCGPAGAVALTAALLAPFVGKAYHMDDSLFLAVAEQVRQHPLDPFGFEYNWYQRPEPMAAVTQNPPLGGYLLAAVRIAAGPGELAAHLCMLAITAGCAAVAYAIARRLCGYPTLAVLLAMATPGFVTSATNVMADVPLLFLWLLAVWFTIRAAQDGRPGELWLAGAAVSAAAMTKYFGFAAAPLLIAYWIVKTRRVAPSLLGLVLPVLVLAGWGAFSQARYGVFHPLAAAGLSIEAKGVELHGAQAAATLAFLGGIAAWPLMLLAAAGRLSLAARIVLYVLVGLVFADAWFQWDGLAQWSRFRATTTVLCGLMMLAGLLVTAVALAAWRARPDAESALLGMWLLGTLAFAAFFNWTTNARILLPALLPAALLTVRWVEGLPENRRLLVSLRAACGLAAVLALAVAWADTQCANAARTFARSTLRELLRENQIVFFTGHLGFQHYAEAEGARPLDLGSPSAKPGDLVATPATNTQALVAGIVTQRLGDESFLSSTGLHTDDVEAQAGFYSFLTGPLPYNFASRVPIASYAVERVVSVAPSP